tara:strand:+ start:1640 stop:1981 length:342 start_codon:yes stop_codon:yes gene_type:complete
MALSVADIVNGSPRLRSKKVDYGNGLIFELKSFTAAAFKELAAEMVKHAKDPTDDHVVASAIRFIEGENHIPSETEILAFRTNLDTAVLNQIVLDGINLNSGAMDVAAQAKKS